MTSEMLMSLVGKYDIAKPEVIFLRHNENKTYRVHAGNGRAYLLRIHDPLNVEMKGLQHTYDGILEEVQMLEQLGKWSTCEVQTPIRNKDGELITTIEYEEKLMNCSILTWLNGRDMNEEDISNHELVIKLGRQLAELHTFFRQYEPSAIEFRPHQGKARNEQMIRVIQSGVHKNLFTSSDASTIEQTLQLINARLDYPDQEKGPNLIHGDLNMGNIIITNRGEVSFIDFGFFGTGYSSLDVAMGAIMLPSDQRETFLKNYYKEQTHTTNDLLQLEGFMLVSIIGYYVFQMGNVKVHSWMRERMPKFCANCCQPFLNGESILHKI